MNSPPIPDPSHGIGVMLKRWRHRQWLLPILAVLMSTPLGTSTAFAQTDSQMQTCLMQQLALAPGHTTISTLRQQCADSLAKEAGLLGQEAFAERDTTVRPGSVPEGEQPVVAAPTALERRYGSELAIRENPFGITPHKPNYLLFAAYSKNVYPEAFEQQFDEKVSIDHTEAKFQVSLKFPLAVGLFDGRADIMAAYTNRSFWQVYNDDSAPFRDTNHEPEAWISFLNDYKILGWRNVANQAGFVHQSNGRGGDLSRSWNRVYAQFLFEKEDQLVWVKPWYRIPEDDSDDDNPDINDYMGFGEIGWSYAIKGHNITAQIRNYLESGFSKGTTQVSWSFPIPHYDHFRGYVQVFNGYGETLIDYNKQNTTIGVGVSLTDWLY